MTSPALEAQSYTIAGLRVRLESSAPVLLDSMSKAFSLSRLTDTSRTGDGDLVSISAAVREDAAFFEGMPADIKERYEAAGEDENPLAFLAPEGGLRVMVKSKGSGSYVSVDAEGREVRLVCQRLTKGKAPLHFQSVLVPALKQAFLLRGKLLLHAGCMEGPEGEGVLIVGLSGQGKTTTCISLALAGFRYVSDDLLVVGKDEAGEVRAQGIREKMNLTKNTVMMFPELRKYKSGFKLFGGEPKLPVDPAEVFGLEGFSSHVRVRHLVTLQRGGPEPALVSQPAESILNHIIQNHTFEIWPKTQRAVSARSMDLIWGMLGQARIWKLTTGPDPVGLGPWMHGQIRGLAQAQK